MSNLFDAQTIQEGLLAIANSMLKVAEAIDRHADATEGIARGLKYGEIEGMSVAEALEVASNNIADSIDALKDGE